jgi:ketosteroid isomerase-like protein
MPASRPSTAAIAEQVRSALQSADLTAFADLLDPDVRWGAPDDPAPPCQNRSQVLQWYRKGRESGARATVTEVVATDDTILVGLRVTGNQAGRRRGGGEADRWQVLTVRAGRVVDIRGFESRAEAASRAGVPV